MTESVTMYASGEEEPFSHVSAYDAVVELDEFNYPEKLTTDCVVLEAQFIKRPPSWFVSSHMIYSFLETLEENIMDTCGGEDFEFRFDFDDKQLKDLAFNFGCLLDQFTERKDDIYVYVQKSTKEIPVTKEDIEELYKD